MMRSEVTHVDAGTGTVCGGSGYVASRISRATCRACLRLLFVRGRAADKRLRELPNP